MDLDTALTWAAGRSAGILITIRRDGRPQSSDISYALSNGVFRISVRDHLAKTNNIRRDDRVVLHVTDRPTWSYVSFDGTAELSAVAADPGDESVDELVAYYRAVAGEHPDWSEYRGAMVAEGRLLVRFTPRSAVGQLH